MEGDPNQSAEQVAIFRRLFEFTNVQAALLDLKGVILATNSAWQRYGVENGQSADYCCVGKDYLSLCEPAVVSGDIAAMQASVGLLAVLQTRRTKFTMIYPCHHPSERRWYCLWAESQLPAFRGVIVAHSFCKSRPLIDNARQADLVVVAAQTHSNSAAQKISHS